MKNPYQNHALSNNQISLGKILKKAKKIITHLEMALLFWQKTFEGHKT
jgi:hypothetical protein